MQDYRLVYQQSPDAPVSEITFHAEDLAQAFCVAERESQDKTVELWDSIRCLGRLTPLGEHVYQIG